MRRLTVLVKANSYFKVDTAAAADDDDDDDNDDNDDDNDDDDDTMTIMKMMMMMMMGIRNTKVGSCGQVQFHQLLFQLATPLTFYTL